MNKPSNWQLYLDLLAKKNIPEASRRWYVFRVEQFLKIYPKTKLTDLSVSAIESYLLELSRNTSISDWQFKQAVDAIKLLLVDLSKTLAAREIDWDYWQQAAKTLPADHVTVAANNTIDEALNLNGYEQYAG